MVFLLLFLIAVNCVLAQETTGPSHGKKVVCYMHNWSNYRKDLGQFSIEDIEPSLCTNIVYSFAALDENTNAIRSGDLWQDLETDYGKAGYRRVNALKEQYPHLKVTISLGGWAEGSVKYSKMAATAETRKTFVDSVMVFLKEYNFDGLDMHWKFPTLREGKPYDKANYVLLLKELKEAFAPHNYMLTAAFGAGKSTMEAAYDLAKINKHLDYMHLLAFDYHGAWDNAVGSNAPLRGIGKNDFNNLEFSINYMINNGVTPSKIVLGLPAFGRTFELKDPNVKSIEFGRTPTKSVGFQGPYTVENGLMGYFEICMETSNKSSHWSHHWDDRSATAYIRDKERVICYDSGRSLSIKVKMAVDRGLGGLMVWSLDTDDFKGLCEAETEPYRDFTERYQKLVGDTRLPRAITALNLGDGSNPNEYYTASNGALNLRLPQRQPDSNYNLLRVVNDAASLATQEKKILDAMGGNVDNQVEENTGTSGFRSDYTYYPRVGYWFKVHPVPKYQNDWHAARRMCHYEGAELASPRNAAVMAAIKEVMAAAEPKAKLYYSGVHQTFGDGVYTSVEGIPLEKLYTSNWDADKPRSSQKRQQCMVFSSEGRLQDYSCDENLPFICYRKFCDTDRITECGTIDKAYKFNSKTGHCYKYHENPAAWEHAVRVCGAEGGYLAIVNSAAEAAELANLASSSPRPWRATSETTVALGFRQWGQIDSWWTVQGQTLEQSGFEEWCDGCPDYQRHPQRRSSRQACGGLLNTKLDDIWCDFPYAFICEKEKETLANLTGVGCRFLSC